MSTVCTNNSGHPCQHSQESNNTQCLFFCFHGDKSNLLHFSSGDTDSLSKIYTSQSLVASIISFWFKRNLYHRLKLFVKANTKYIQARQTHPTQHTHNQMCPEQRCAGQTDASLIYLSDPHEYKTLYVSTWTIQTALFPSPTQYYISSYQFSKYLSPAR